MIWLLGDIKKAYDKGEAEGASHLLVVRDSFDGETYPLYVMPGQNPKDHFPETDDLLEVYRYALGWEIQSKEFRSYHIEMDVPVSDRFGNPVKPDLRVPRVAETIYNQERAQSNVASFWPEWIEAPNDVRMQFERRAIAVLAVVDSF